MKIHGYFVLIAVFVLLLAVAAGCTTPSQPAAATQAPQATQAQQATAQQAAPTAAVVRSSSAALDTTINVHRNELVCIDIQERIGVDYLYPDQQFRLEVSSAGPGTINPTISLVDKNNEFRIREVERHWDNVQKTWLYDGVVTVVRLSDITKPTQKEFRIKEQGKYYLCADDRGETGSQDTVYQVPVKLFRL